MIPDTFQTNISDKVKEKDSKESENDDMQKEKGGGKLY